MSIAIASDIVEKSFAYCCCCDYNMTLSVASFNVHMWVDGEWECNKDRVLEIVKVSKYNFSHFAIGLSFNFD